MVSGRGETADFGAGPGRRPAGTRPRYGDTDRSG